jgi:hypothetical protein
MALISVPMSTPLMAEAKRMEAVFLPIKWRGLDAGQVARPS